MNTLILTNGAYGDYSFCKKDLMENGTYDFVICADRGMQHARTLNICPDLIVGDFDSGSQADLVYYEEKEIPIERFNPEKDETDTELAIKRAIEKGTTGLTIYGGLGNRFDHSLANVHLLWPLLQKGVQARLMDPHNEVTLVKDQITLQGELGDLVSLIPFFGDAKGVTTKGLGYPLSDAVLKMGSSLGVSNYLTQKEAEVTLTQGVLVVIRACD